MSDTRGLSISLSKLNHEQTKSKRFFAILKNQLNSSRVSIISTISLIRSGLDISNLLSANLKQISLYDNNIQAFLFEMGSIWETFALFMTIYLNQNCGFAGSIQVELKTYFRYYHLTI